MRDPRAAQLESALCLDVQAREVMKPILEHRDQGHGGHMVGEVLASVGVPCQEFDLLLLQLVG